MQKAAANMTVHVLQCVEVTRWRAGGLEMLTSDSSSFTGQTTETAPELRPRPLEKQAEMSNMEQLDVSQSVPGSFERASERAAQVTHSARGQRLTGEFGSKCTCALGQSAVGLCGSG